MTNVIKLKSKQETAAERELKKLSDKQLDNLGISNLPAFAKGHIDGEKGFDPINYQHADYYLGYF